MKNSSDQANLNIEGDATRAKHRNDVIRALQDFYSSGKKKKARKQADSAKKNLFDGK